MEIWKVIPEYEGIYEASNLGRIRTSASKMTSNKLYPVRIWQQRIIKPKHKKRGRGYDERVDLWKDGNHKTMLVARLVARAFCEGYFEGATVNHIDGNPSNNSASNLEWVPLKENIKKGFDTGLYPTCKKIRLMFDDDTYKDFRSLSEASVYLGYNKGFLSDKIKKGERGVHSKYGEYCTFILR